MPVQKKDCGDFSDEVNCGSVSFQPWSEYRDDDFDGYEEFDASLYDNVDVCLQTMGDLRDDTRAKSYLRAASGEDPAYSPWQVESVAFVCLLLTIFKIVTFYLAVNWMVPTDASSMTQGVNIFALSATAEGQENSLTPSDWAKDLMDPENEKSLHVKFEGEIKRDRSRNILRGMNLAGSDCVTKKLELVDTLVGAEFGAAQLEKIFAVARPNFTYVNVPGNQFRAEGIEMIVRSLKWNEDITFFNVSKNKMKPEAGKHLEELLKENQHLTELWLNDNPLGAEGTRMIAVGLGENICLQKLEMKNVTPEESQSSKHDLQLAEFGTSLGKSMMVNKTLVFFDISQNRIPKAAVKGLTDGLAQNKSLQTLFMKHCQIGNPGTHVFSKFLPTNTTLKTVSLYSNGIADAGGKTFQAGLKGNKGLKVFNIEKNDMTFVVVVLTHRGGLDGNDPKITSDFNDLKLRNCAKAYVNDSSVTALDVSQCRTYLAGVQWIVDNVLNHNTHVVAFDISDNGIGNSGAKAVASLLDTNRYIRSLKVKSNGLTDDGAQHFVPSLKRNKVLSELLDISGNPEQGFIVLVLVHNGAYLGAGATIVTDGKDAKLRDCALAKENHSSVTELKLESMVPAIGPREASWLCKNILDSNTNVRYVDASKNSIGDGGAEAFGKTLQRNNTISTLLLKSTGMGNKAAKIIADALPTNSGLDGTLNVSGNTIRMYVLVILHNGSYVGASADVVTSGDDDRLRRTAYACSHLHEPHRDVDSLNLSGMSPLIESADMEWLASNVVATNQHVHTFNVGKNPIGDGGATALGSALKSNSAIRTLELYDCQIGNTGASGLANGLKQNSYVSKLDLDNNSIAKSGGSELGSMLRRNSSITSFEISNNNLGEKGGSELCTGLASNSSVKTFVISKNNIQDDGAIALGGAIASNRALSTVDATEIGCNFYANCIMWQNCNIAENQGRRVSLKTSGDSGFQQKVGKMANNDSSITSLNFNGQALANVDCEWLSGRFANNSNLDTLTMKSVLSNNKLDLICSGLARSRVTTFDISGSSLSDADPLCILSNLTYLNASSNSFGDDARKIVSNIGRSVRDIDLSSSCGTGGYNGMAMANTLQSCGKRSGSIDLSNHGWENNVECAYKYRDIRSSLGFELIIDWNRVERTYEREEARLAEIERQRQLAIQRQREAEEWRRNNPY